VHNNYHAPSLLPYLDECSGKFSLKISLVDQDSAILEKTAYPFLIVSDSAPLTRLVEATVVTDTGNEIKKLFLLVQRDHYLLSGDTLRPLTNKAIDTLWQQAFSLHTGDKLRHSLIPLSGQLNEEGRITHFQPLFFCKLRQVFFHPPCPECGLPMEQCENDDILVAAGLQSFSDSLARYLFCPTCHPSGRGEFYVYELGPSDPPQLKDRRALIKSFGVLQESEKQIYQFPCVGCSEHPRCYVSEYLAPTRIVPFSFYPFYMFAFEAALLNAPDFLALVSGAPVQEIEARLSARREFGRLNCIRAVTHKCTAGIPFLFSGDDRYFGEVLYLKLSFLSDVLQNFMVEIDPFEHPDLRFSIDNIWIHFAEHNGLLPFLWNFRIQYININGPPCEDHDFPKSPTFPNLFYWGLLWFYTLIVNPRQNFTKILASMKETVNHFLCDKNFSFVSFCRGNSDLTFKPENLFWNPEKKLTDNTWIPLWEKTLHLGWSLLEKSFQHLPEWSPQVFWDSLEDLRQEVKDTLFLRTSTEYRPSSHDENAAICDILEKIASKWRLHPEPDTEELKETVILSTERDTKYEELKETVILSPEGGKKDTVSSSSEKNHSDEDDSLEETVILKPTQSEIKGKDRA
jgi:hypothetical protein